MAFDSWSSRVSASSRRTQYSRSVLYEESDVDEDLRTKFLCPFCALDFDIVGLCCHIDEDHPVEAKDWVCPVCGKRAGMDIVGHITMQHGSFFKVDPKRRLRKGGSNSAFSILKKELREGSWQSFLKGSSFSSSNAEPDPLLSSFIVNAPCPENTQSIQPLSSVDVCLMKSSTNGKFRERTVQKSMLSKKDLEEKSQRCEFVQGLLLSTILDNKL